MNVLKTWADHRITLFILLFVLLHLVSYWVILALAPFSDNPLSVTSEPFFPLSLVIAALAFGMLLRLWRRTPPRLPPADPLAASATGEVGSLSILRKELRQHWSDLRWVLLVTAVLFVFFAWAYGMGFSGDGAAQLIPYLQLDEAEPPYYFLQVYWPPFTAIFYGGLLDVGGVPLAMTGQLLLTLAAGGAFYLAAAPWGRAWAWFAMVLWWANWVHQIYFHLIGADALMVWGFVLWLAALRFALHYQTVGFWLLVGLLAAMNTLIRAGNFVLMAALLGCLLTLRANLRMTLLNVFASAGIFLVVIGGYIAYNGLRYETYTLARSGETLWFTAAYNDKSLIELDNGPATRRFARLVEEHLLVTDVYNGVTLEEFLSTPSSRTMDDSIALIDRTEGWDTNYVLLREVGFEALRAHPIEFFFNNFSNFLRLLVIKPTLPYVDVGITVNDETVYLVERTYSSFMTSRPDGALPDAAEVSRIDRELNALTAPVFDQVRRSEVLSPLGKLWLRFGLHPVLMWGIAGLALVWSRGRARLLWLLLVVVIVLVVAPASTVVVQDRYRVPLDSALLFMMVVGLAHGSKRFLAQASATTAADPAAPAAG